METINSAARELSYASDRYLFLLVLLTFGAFGWHVMQKILRMHEEAKAETAKAHAEAAEVRGRWQESSERFAVAIERNTEAFRNASSVMTECKAVHTETQRVLAAYQGRNGDR